MDATESLPSQTSQVVFGPLPDGAVLFSTRDEVYYGLNRVGALIWALLPPKTNTLSELCDVLGRQFTEVDPATLKNDVAALLEELHANGLVEYLDQEHPGAGPDPDTDRQADSPPSR